MKKLGTFMQKKAYNNERKTEFSGDLFTIEKTVKLDLYHKYRTHL